MQFFPKLGPSLDYTAQNLIGHESRPSSFRQSNRSDHKLPFATSLSPTKVNGVMRHDMSQYFQQFLRVKLHVTCLHKIWCLAKLCWNKSIFHVALCSIRMFFLLCIHSFKMKVPVFLLKCQQFSTIAIDRDGGRALWRPEADPSKGKKTLDSSPKIIPIFFGQFFVQFNIEVTRGHQRTNLAKLHISSEMWRQL